MPRTIIRSELSLHGESQDVEFKRSLSLQKAGFESLCGMVNSESGKGSVLFVPGWQNQLFVGAMHTPLLGGALRRTIAWLSG